MNNKEEEEKALLKEYIKHLLKEFNAVGGGGMVGFGLVPAFYPGNNNKKKKKSTKTKNR